MASMNVFRILADVAHFLSKCILIWAIHSNKSAEGVSLITQILYIAVFVTRYLDLFWTSPSDSYWNFFLKNFYIWSSIYIIILMTRIYARTREREKAWKLGGFAAGGSLVAAPLVCLIFRGIRRTDFAEILWTFSIILESVCVLPQLLLLRQTTVPTVIDSYYLLMLGSYRALYILNWVVRGVGSEHHFEPISIIFGVVQTALYLDFAWVYWTRQRVKLRGGGIVDSDDLRKGFLVTRVLGARRNASLDEEERPMAHDGGVDDDSAPANTIRPNRWGARGISVSADDTLPDHQKQPSKPKAHHAAGIADEAQDAFADGDDDLFSGDEDADVIDGGHPSKTVLNSGDAWGESNTGKPNTNQ